MERNARKTVMLDDCFPRGGGGLKRKYRTRGLKTIWRGWEDKKMEED